MVIKIIVTLLLGWTKKSLDPLDKFLISHFAACDGETDPDDFFVGGAIIHIVHAQCQSEKMHAHAFVPIHKRMILNHRVPRPTGFLDDGRIQVDSIECMIGTKKGRLQQPLAQNSMSATGSLDHAMMNG